MIKKINHLLRGNKNYYYLLIGLIISSILAFTNNIILARNFGPENYGLFFSLLTLAMLFSNLNVSGIPIYLQDLISKKVFRRNSETGNIFLLIILFFTLLYLSIFFLWAFFGPNDQLSKKILLIFSLLIIFQPFIEISKSLLQINLYFKKLSLLNILINFIRFVSLIILILFFTDYLNLINITYIFLLGSIIPFFISTYIIKIFFKYDFVYLFNSKKILLKKTFHTFLNLKFYFFSHILYFIYVSIDILIIKYFLSDFDAGIFFAAFSIILGMQLFSEATVRTFSFQYFEKSLKNKNKLKTFFNKNIQFLLYLSIPICLFIFYFSEIIIEILYGNSFYLSSEVLKILIFIIPIKLIVTNLSLLVITVKKSLFNTLAILIITLIKIPLMMLLIIFYKLSGAVFCLIIIEILYLFLIKYFVDKHLYHAKI